MCICVNVININDRWKY